MRRRWKRRALWAAVLLGVLLLAIPATLAQAAAAIRHGRGAPTMRRFAPVAALVVLGVVIGLSTIVG